MQELDYAKITQHMKQARKEANYTQEQIATDLNCTPAYISNVENNRVKLNLRLLSYYSKICCVPLADFLESGLSEPAAPASSPATRETDNSEESERINKELLEVLQTFTIEERKKLIDMLKIWKSDVSSL